MSVERANDAAAVPRSAFDPPHALPPSISESEVEDRLESGAASLAIVAASVSCCPLAITVAWIVAADAHWSVARTTARGRAASINEEDRRPKV